MTEVVGYAVVEQDILLPSDLDAGRVLSCHAGTADGLIEAAERLAHWRATTKRVSLATLTRHGLRRPDNEQSRVINRICSR